METKVTNVTQEVIDQIDFENLSLKDIRKNPLSKNELRSVVELFYDFQDFRIMSGNRKFAVDKSKTTGDTQTPKPSVILSYVQERCKNTEKTIGKFLQIYAEEDPIGKWLLSIPGIGGTLACGLLSYIDIERCKTAGALWSYAGWSGPTTRRKKGEKINYNPKFRTLCWKVGQQFIKLKNNPNDIYGHLYEQKKQFYIDKNENGGFAEKAKAELEVKKFDPNSESYKAYIQGKLPKGHINAMATRFAVKIFLSHLFTLWYEYVNGVPAPRPFVEEHLGHVHIMEPPNRDILFGNN